MNGMAIPGFHELGQALIIATVTFGAWMLVQGGEIFHHYRL